MEKPKLWPPPCSNLISDSHKSWQRWLRCGPLHLCKSSSWYAQGFCFRACVTLRTKSVYSASFFPFFRFFGFSQLATAKASRSILTQNMPKHAVPRKDVPFRGRDHKIEYLDPHFPKLAPFWGPLLTGLNNGDAPLRTPLNRHRRRIKVA